ncbi:head-tail connector protein [Brevundimonas sp.]
MAVVVITPPEPLVSLEDAKDHLRVTEGDEDGLIEGYIAAASAWIDGPAGWLGRSIGEQTLELRGNVFACGERLPFGPVIAVTEIHYVDAQGVDQLLDPTIYQIVEGGLASAHGRSWPSLRGDAEGVRILYQAGEDTVPAQVRQAVLLLVGQWFRNRMAVNVGNIANELPFGVEALLSPLRRFT